LNLCASSAAPRIIFPEQVTAKRGLNAYSSRPWAAPCHLRQRRSLSMRNREDFFGLELAVGPEIHHHLAHNHAQTTSLRRFEANVATILVNGRVNHRGRRAVSRQFVEEERRFLPRFRTGEFAFQWENILAPPRQQLAFAPRHGRILGNVGVAIDQAREDHDRSAIAPAHGDGPGPFAQVVVIADLREAAVLYDDGAITPAAKGAIFRGVNQEPADSKRAGVRLHEVRWLREIYGS
jgi:hypothetical protein